MGCWPVPSFLNVGIDQKQTSPRRIPKVKDEKTNKIV